MQYRNIAIKTQGAVILLEIRNIADLSAVAFMTLIVYCTLACGGSAVEV